MLQRLKSRLHELRQQPESVRLQTAIRYTIITGIIVALLWLLVFLPLQIAL